jgi:Kef-type K+ transport system membrane component KefB
MNLLLLVVLSALMHASRSFDAAGAPAGAGTALGCGYLLVTAFLAGEVFKQLRLPKLTGYIVAGIVAGPMALGLVSAEMVANLDVVNGVAISMIALTAGTELELRSMKRLLRSIRWITVVGVLGTTVLLAGAAFLLRPFLPFLGRLSPLQAGAVALVLGVVTVAQSPAVVVALRDELGAEGPVARTVLGVVVLADLVVIVMFAVVSTLARATLGATADVIQTASMLGWQVLGSLAAGAVVGALVALYLRRVASEASLFLLLMAVVIAEVGRRLHFDPLLVALSAGVLVRNATRVADALQRELQPASLPVYVVFFAVAGANLHLHAFATMWLPAGVLVLVRGVGLLVGSSLGARLAGAPAEVRRYAGFGLLPQAGLALALSMLFASSFPEFGPTARALTLGVVGLNELVAPALYRWALVRSGEAGQRACSAAPSPVQVPLEVARD